jgi:hypothetical protein
MHNTLSGNTDLGWRERDIERDAATLQLLRLKESVSRLRLLETQQLECDVMRCVSVT